MRIFVYSLVRFHTGILPARKVFLVKEQFVKLSSEAHSKRIREHHPHTLANTPQDVKRFLFINFTMSASNRHAKSIFII
jgi:hypothetical protein